LLGPSLITTEVYVLGDDAAGQLPRASGEARGVTRRLPCHMTLYCNLLTALTISRILHDSTVYLLAFCPRSSPPALRTPDTDENPRELSIILSVTRHCPAK